MQRCPDRPSALRARSPGGPSRRRAQRLALTVALAGLATACGSKHGEPGPQPAPDEVERLWAMAPQDADGGLVASANALASAEAALSRLDALGRASPELGVLVHQLEARLDAALPAGHIRRWTDLGMSAERGYAQFRLPDGGALYVLPVTARDAFVKAVGAQVDKDGDHVGALVCRMIADRYACADHAASLDAPRAAPTGRRPGRLRGDLEIWIARSLAQKAGLDATGDIEIAAAIAPGRLTVRTHVPMHPSGLLAAVARSSPVKLPGGGDTSGLLVANLAPVIAAIPTASGSEAITDALRALAGPVTAVARPGRSDLDLRVALDDVDAIAALLRRCDQLFPAASGIVAAPTADGCHLRIPTPIPGRRSIELDAWIEDGALRAARDRNTPVAATVRVPATEIGKELGDGTWTLAAWGRGALTSGMGMPGRSGAVSAAPFLLLSELGLGARIDDAGIDGLLFARTIFDAPDDVVAAFTPILAKAARGEPLDADLTAVAARFPTSPYAADAQAGETGMLLPVAAIGMVSAVVIPLFMDHAHATTASEADLQLDALGSGAKAYFDAHHQTFPVGSAALTPAVSCCEQAHLMCAPAPADWTDPMWKTLGVHGPDRPFRFQYTYRGSATEFTAQAVADLDCDPTSGVTTYTLHGQVVDGAARIELVRATAEN